MPGKVTSRSETRSQRSASAWVALGLARPWNLTVSRRFRSSGRRSAVAWKTDFRNLRVSSSGDGSKAASWGRVKCGQSERSGRG